MKKIFFSLTILILTQLSAYTIKVGDEVSMVADKVKVRSCAGLSCSGVGRVSIDAIGKVIDGPADKDGYYWWKIDWDDDNPDGWTPTPKNDYSWYYEKPNGLHPGGSSSSPEIVDSNNPILHWNKIHGVHHYLISLLEQTNNGTKIIKYYDNIPANKTSFQIPDTLQDGKRYLWSIIPYDDDGDMGLKADYIYFKIKEQKDEISVSNKLTFMNIKINNCKTLTGTLVRYVSGNPITFNVSIQGGEGAFSLTSSSQYTVSSSNKKATIPVKFCPTQAKTYHAKLMVTPLKQSVVTNLEYVTLNGNAIADHYPSPSIYEPGSSSGSKDELLVDGNSLKFKWDPNRAGLYQQIEINDLTSHQTITHWTRNISQTSITNLIKNHKYSWRMRSCDGGKNNCGDFSSKLYFTAKEASVNQPTLSDIYPRTVKASLYDQTIRLTGTNFTKDTKVEFSFDNVKFQDSHLAIKLLSSNVLTFHTMLYSKTGYLYYRVRNGNGTPSHSIKLTVQSTTRSKPILINTSKKNYAINSGESITVEFVILDMEDIVNSYQNNINKNYQVNIEWGDGQKQTITQSYKTSLSIKKSHKYTTAKTNPFTITARAIDSDGYKSKPVRIFVKVKGSSSNHSISIKKIAIGNKAVAKDLCHKARSVGRTIDTATGAENFSITPLKVKGVFELPFTLQYNSLLLSEGDMSKGWSHNYTVSSYVEMAIDKSSIRVYWDNSAKKYNDFNLSDTKNVYTSTDKATQDDVLTYNEDDETYTLKRKYGTIYKYNSEGYLQSISNYKNQKIDIAFDDNGRLKQITEPISGVYLKYYYNSNGKLDRVEDALGRVAYLKYYNNGLLREVEFPDHTKHSFEYNVNDQIERYNITDTKNHKIQYFYHEYYDTKRVATEYDSKNAISNFSYDTTKTPNRIYSLYADSENNPTRTIYDANNLNPYRITYADGTREDFEYYDNGKIKSKTDRAKHTTRYYYDNHGNMNRVVYDDGSEEQYTYDDNRNLIRKKIYDSQKNSYTTRYFYDSNNNLKTTHLPNGDEITYTYNSNNQMTSKTIGGKTTKYRYYEDTDPSQGHLKGLLKEVETPEGLITLYTYDKAGRLITETNPQGGVTTYTYDAMDRLKVITNPDNKTKTFDYDMMGNKIEEKDFNGNYTKYKYDNNGNLIKKIDALNHEYKFEYDSADRLKRAYDPKGYYTEYHYDSMGRVKETIDKRGNKTTFTYDAMGNLKEEYDPYGHRLYTKTYDAKNNLIKVVDALNHTTTTDYTVFGKPSKITDPLQRVTEFKYDALGRLKKVINAKQKEATQDYNPTGILKEFTDAGKNTTTFTYDDDGNLLTTTTASGSMTQNIYEKGLLSKFINGRKDTKTFTYDKLNRVIEAKDKDGTITFTYDNNGNLLTVTENGKMATYTYDALDRVTSYTDIYGNTIRYDYDEVGNLKRLYYPNNHYIEYKYDENSNLIEVKDGNLKTTFEYDKNNRLIKLTRPNKTVMARTYNNKVQLKSQTDKTSKGEIIYSVTYNYDEAGNIKSEKRVPPLKPTLPINLTMNYKKGNLLKDANQTQAIFDDDDNMVKLGNKTFTYDSRNRLIAYNDTTYSYDSQNHRIAQTTNGKTTTYTINPNATLSQLLELKEPNRAKTTYIYGAGLLYQKKGSKRLYYHYDLRGSTIALTDDNGNIVDRFSYLPYGKVSHDLGNTQTPFLYNGRDGVMSDVNGLYYMRARYYDPAIKRFINRDTLLGDIDKMASLNRFAYVNGNPVDSVDSLGLEPTTWERFTRTAGFVLDPIGHYVAAGTKVAAGALISTGEVIGKYTFNKDYDTRSGVGVGLFKEGVSESIEGFNALEDIGAVLTGGSVDDVELGIRNGSLPQKDNKTSRGISVGIDIGYLGKGMLENADDYAKLIKNGISKPKHAVPYILKKPADILMDAYSAGKSVSNYYNDCL